MGLIHSRAAKKRNKAEAKLLNAQTKQVEGGGKWQKILDSIESGEASWDDLSRTQKLSMPMAWQMRCRAADRKNRADS